MHPYLERVQDSPFITSAAIYVLPQRPSLLDRRASNNISDLPGHLSVSDLVSQAPIPSSGTLVYRGSPRRPSAGFLPFLPLTPIMASPLITPEVAHAKSDIDELC